MEKARIGEIYNSQLYEVLRIIDAEEINKNRLFQIIPELCELEEFEVDSSAHNMNVLDHSITAARMVQNPIEKLTLLFHDIGKPLASRIKNEDKTDFSEKMVDRHPQLGADLARPILERLLGNEKIIDDICNFIVVHDDWYDMVDEVIEKLIKIIPSENLENLFNIQMADLNAHEKGFVDYKMSDLIAAQKLIKEKSEKLFPNE